MTKEKLEEVKDIIRNIDLGVDSKVDNIYSDIAKSLIILDGKLTYYIDNYEALTSHGKEE